MATVSRLFVYPIKSTAPLELVAADVLPEGLAHDRRYVVTDGRGRFLTARRHPRLVLIRSEIDAGRLIVDAPGAPTLELDPNEFADRYDPVRIWRDEVASQRCGSAADAWFSAYLDMDARLYYLGERSSRPRADGGVVSFADAAPLLLIGQESLDDLNMRLRSPVGVRNFRPNIVVTGAAARAEDDWPDFRLGAVRFETLWQCARCVLTTVDPDTGRKRSDGEPLKTLREMQQHEGSVLFGRNVAPRDGGSIHVGQRVEFL